MQFVTTRQFIELYRVCNYSIAEIYGCMRKLREDRAMASPEKQRRLHALKNLLDEKEEAQACRKHASEKASAPAGRN